jgi:type IV secretion/conjugal transfer VirB4 family ATPase
MMSLAEYRKRAQVLADFLPWAGLVAPGIVLNKDGSFQRTAAFRGPDLDSATQSELIATAAHLNNALKRLRSSWAIFVEAARYPSAHYPKSPFPESLSWLVDEERRAMFEKLGSHFESAYYLTLLFMPPPEQRSRAGQMFIESEESGTGVNWREYLHTFVTETDRFRALLEAIVPEVHWLNDEETLTYLHSTISPNRQRIVPPEIGFHLDSFLTDVPFSGGLSPKLGEHHLRIVTVRGFPTATWPGVLDELNRLGFAYRWVTRFMFLDKTDAERELTKVRRQWFAKRKSIVTLLRETIFQEPSPLLELGSDAVGFGYATATVVVSDPNPSTVDEHRKNIERVIQGRGFVAISEGLNAVEAWLSSLPGHVYANVRQPPISTLNLAHLIPHSAVWAGPEGNAHLNGPAWILTRTDGATPFRLVTHVGDVGHTLIVGPTGAGKSVLLATLILQFRRYRNSRVFIFDKGRSARALILGLGGEHYELAGEGGDVAFQPLARIDQEAERAWASEWVQGLFVQENLEITPSVKEALWSALQSLASASRAERTLTGLAVLLQSGSLRQALHPYLLSGPHGALLDADTDRLGGSDVQGFEMQELMHTKSAVLPVLTYLFHRLEERFDGSPALIVLDEAWAFLDHPTFAGRIREWLKTLRKKNVSVIFATHSLTDIQGSAIAAAIIESCPSRIFLPSAQALEPQLKKVYESFGLNDRQIRLIARAQPKRDYYYQSRLGHRVFELGLGPIALAFAAVSKPEDQRVIDEILKEAHERGTVGSAAESTSTCGADFARAWLIRRGLPWAAELLAGYDKGGQQ